MASLVALRCRGLFSISAKVRNRLACAVAYTLLAVNIVIADDWTNRFEVEAPIAWKQLSRMRLDFSYTAKGQAHYLQGKEVNLITEKSFKCGRNSRLVQYRDQAGGVEFVCGFNSQYHFKISRPSLGASWQVDEVVLGNVPQAFYTPDNVEDVDVLTESYKPPEFRPSRILRQIYLAIAQFKICGVKMGYYHVKGIYLFDCEDFRVISANEEQLDGNELVKVCVSWSINGNPTIPDSGQKLFADLWCDPTRHWAIIKFTISESNGTLVESRYIQYKPEESNEFPVVSRMSGEQRSGGQLLDQWELEVNGAFGQSYPEHDFRLSAFGLPEPPGISWGYRRWYVGAALFGVLVIAAGLVAKRRQQSVHEGQSGKAKR